MLVMLCNNGPGLPVTRALESTPVLDMTNLFGNSQRLILGICGLRQLQIAAMAAQA